MILNSTVRITTSLGWMLNTALFVFCIIQGNNIFNGLNAKQYETVIHLLESAILSTDLAVFLK